jgi:hypothetical protein
LLSVFGIEAVSIGFTLSRIVTDRFDLQKPSASTIIYPPFVAVSLNDCKKCRHAIQITRPG